MTVEKFRKLSKEDVAFLSSTDEIIEDVRNGRMVILVDAEDRENEGDLVIPAQMATPDVINFMARFGCGLICLSLTRERSEELNLPLMSAHNQSRHATNFTVSIEAREGISTGISAHDRSHTIAVAIDPTKNSTDIVSPGHVFPLVAKDGGVLVRTGHTEAAVDIARLAGLYPAGVICEIMNDDGTMARLPDLVEFAQFHGLKIGTISDLIAYRRRNDNLMYRVAETDMEVEGIGTFRAIAYRNTVDREEHLALVKGSIKSSEATLIRMHRANVFDDLIGTGGAARSKQLRAALRAIEAEGRGVAVILRNVSETAISDWVGSSHSSEQVKDNMLREYGVGAQILTDLGVAGMTLLSNTEVQEPVALEGYGLSVAGRRPIDTE